MDDTHSRLLLGGLLHAAMGIPALVLSIINNTIGLMDWIAKWGSEISLRA